VDEESVFIGYKNFDQIFKEYMINVQGKQYRPGEFLKILRKTKDGMTSRSIVDDNPLVLNVAYKELDFELDLVKRGGLKRGYIQPDKPITKEAMQSMREGFQKLYDSDANVMALNAGSKFQEASSTSTEMQLNENKASNAEEICKLFGVPSSMVCGSKVGNSMTDYDMSQFIRACVAVMTDIECSLNRDLLNEDEKETFFFSFDTKELTRGSLKERYEAYKIGLEENFLQIDEVRQKEDMEPLGIDWLQLNLNTVFYNPETKEIYTPNTNASANLMDGAGANTASVSDIDQKPSEGGEQENESGTES
jgi:HK97 family phage portal protein